MSGWDCDLGSGEGSGIGAGVREIVGGVGGGGDGKCGEGGCDVVMGSWG